MEKFYHGGELGLMPGDLVLPPSVTGARPAVRGASAEVKRKYRDDRVYITPDVKFALFFAARLKAGSVYQVGSVEPDPHWQLINSEGTGYRETKQCESARVVSVVNIPDAMFDEARALMVPAISQVIDPRRVTPVQREQRSARQAFEKKQRKMHRRVRR